MRPLRILVVEDDALIGLLLAEMLRDMGHQVCGVEATENGAVAAEALFRPDLMIVDAHLREGTGAAAVARIAAARSVPRVLMSGGGFPALHPRDVFLRKPFIESGLARAIEQALDARGAA